MGKPSIYLNNDTGRSVNTNTVSRETTSLNINDPFIQKSSITSSSLDQLDAFRDRTGQVNWLGSSFSGTDIKVVAHLYNTKDNDPRAIMSQPNISDEEYLEARWMAEANPPTITLGSIQTLSLQSYREVIPVRSLGRSHAKGYCSGTRTFGGSMIFTIFEEHPLARLMRAMTANDVLEISDDITTLLPDQLPPIDLTISFANEYGAISSQRIYGVKFLSDGQTYSIEDLLSENVMQFVALDADLMTAHDKVNLDRDARFGDRDIPKTGSTLFEDQYYQSYLDKLFNRRKLKDR